MVFSTPLFLFLFLPGFLGVYYLLPRRYRTVWILAGSWLFYGFWRFDFLLLLVLVTAGNWLAGLLLARAMAPARADRREARIIVVVAVLCNLTVLGYFKYFNFGVNSLNGLLSLAGVGPLRTWEVVLPVGISFYVFQSMSYVLDVYRGDAPADREFVGLAAFVALFPQLVAGPILRYKELAGQLRRREHSWTRAAYGLRRFTEGVCRKVLIADSIAPIANAAFTGTENGAAGSWLGIIAYALQLYYDFSGYSDMAIGLGHMMGFSIIENFDAPYRSRSITEFWRRWHISLSSWLRDYLYIPLGGNRLGTGRTYANLFLVMAIGGLWHGASWNFVLWGSWHGLLLAAERLRRDYRKRKGLRDSEAVGLIPTQIAVLAGWVLFRTADLRAAGTFFASMVGAQGWDFAPAFAWRIGGLELAALAAGLVFLAFERRSSTRSEAAARTVAPLAAVRSSLLWLALGIAAIAKLAADSYTPFLYFQF